MAISQENLKALFDFAKVAEEYCRLIDGLRQGRPAGFYKNLESMLLNLYQAILPVEKEMPDKKHPEFEKLALTVEQWKDVAHVIGKALGEETGALFKWHDGEKPDANWIEQYDSTRAEMLWDDLSGIYHDLYFGLALWRLSTPDSQAESAWEWRFNFESHWGEHLFRAMTTVHEIRYRLYEN